MCVLPCVLCVPSVFLFELHVLRGELHYEEAAMGQVEFNLWTRIDRGETTYTSTSRAKILEETFVINDQ